MTTQKIKVITSRRSTCGTTQMTAKLNNGMYTFQQKAGRKLLQPLMIPATDLPKHPYDLHQMIVNRLRPENLQDLLDVTQYAEGVVRCVEQMRP